MAALFRLVNLVKLYEGRPVLELEDLALGQEDVTAISGPNGSGKTTLLMILALLIRPDAGNLLYRGEPVQGRPAQRLALRREVTYVSQDAYLFHGSVERNLAYGPKLRGLGREERRERADQALAAVGLEGFMGRRARELSRGETQRVALARALALKPRVLLLDEPFANLDPDSARVFERVINDLGGRGTRVIMVTHGREQASRLAGRDIGLEGGRLVRDQTTGG